MQRDGIVKSIGGAYPRRLYLWLNCESAPKIGAEALNEAGG
jgi:hypothetical protein